MLTEPITLPCRSILAMCFVDQPVVVSYGGDPDRTINLSIADMTADAPRSIEPLDKPITVPAGELFAVENADGGPPFNITISPIRN